MRRMVLGTARKQPPELSRGVVEHCVLALIQDDESVAFGIVRILGERGLVTSEGTIYPLLARLRRDGLVATAWRESDAGPPRRYYTITDAGRRVLDTFVGDWMRFRHAVDVLLPGAIAQEGVTGGTSDVGGRLSGPARGRRRGHRGRPARGAGGRGPRPHRPRPRRGGRHPRSHRSTVPRPTGSPAEIVAAEIGDEAVAAGLEAAARAGHGDAAAPCKPEATHCRGPGAPAVDGRVRRPAVHRTHPRAVVRVGIHVLDTRPTMDSRAPSLSRCWRCPPSSSCRRSSRVRSPGSSRAPGSCAVLFVPLAGFTAAAYLLISTSVVIAITKRGLHRLFIVFFRRAATGSRH